MIVLVFALLLSLGCTLWLFKNLRSYENNNMIGTFRSKENEMAHAKYLVFEQDEKNNIKYYWYEQNDFFETGFAIKMNEEGSVYKLIIHDKPYIVVLKKEDTLYFIDDNISSEYIKTYEYSVFLNKPDDK